MSCKQHFQKQGNPSHFNSNFKKEIENQLKTMEEDMMYKAESDSTIIYKEIKKAIFDLDSLSVRLLCNYWGQFYLLIYKWGL
jgi:hypothetical protein